MPYLKTTAAPATDLYFEDSGGTGTPVVLIHGWPLSGRMWEGTVNALTAAGYRCITYDRRGFGQSGRATGGYDYDTFASDLEDVLRETGAERAVLVGFSMGGGEVARYVGRYGEGRVQKIVLAGAVTPFLLKTADNPDGVPGAQFEGMRAAVTKDRIGFLNTFFPLFYKGGLLAPKASDDDILHSKTIAWPASPLGTQQCITAFGETDFRADLARVTVPTLVVHGDDDAVVPFAKSGQRVPEFVGHAEVHTIGGAPHGFTVTHGDKFSEILLKFLDG